VTLGNDKEIMEGEEGWEIVKAPFAESEEKKFLAGLFKF